MPKFFGYDKIIQQRLTEKGAVVYLVYEDMDEINYFFRFVNAYLHGSMKSLMDLYFINKVKKVAGSLDYFVLIRGEFVSRDVLRKIKSMAPEQCKFCMYQWDSVKNNPNAIKISDLFDVKSTFDGNDSVENRWIYRPLFFIPEFVEQKKPDYDILYFCSLHSKRIEILNKLKNLCLDKKIRLCKRVYSKKIIYYKRKYLDKREGYINANDSDITSSKMNIVDTYDFYNRTKVIVDYTHPNQNGLTMRTIEALGCRKKLVTNNKNIYKADFYNPDNILVYDNEDIEISTEFVNTPYQSLASDVYGYYSVDSWINTILGLE